MRSIKVKENYSKYKFLTDDGKTIGYCEIILQDKKMSIKLKKMSEWMDTIWIET